MRWFVSVVAAIVLPGCTDIVGEQVIVGRGPVIQEPRQVGAFTGVANATEADVEILQGSTDGVWIIAEENMIPHLRTQVQNGILRIYTDNVSLRPREQMRVEVDIRRLDRLESSGSGRVDAPLLDATRLEVVSSGAGDIDIPSLLADSIVITSSGSGDIEVSGTAARLRLMMSGAGEVEARELATNVADVTISGAGSAVIRARDLIRAALSAAGWLRYYGSPTVEQTVTGSGRVQRLGS